MKSLLLYENQELPAAAGYQDKDDIIRDLNLKVIFQAACRPVWKEGDSLKQAEKEDFYIYDTMKRIMLVPLENRRQVLYRQQILREALARPKLVRAMYDIGQKAGKALFQNRERGKENRGSTDTGSGELLGSFSLLKRLAGYLDELKELLDDEEFTVQSGLAALKSRIAKEYNTEFRTGFREVMADMEFFTEGGSMIFSMGLGPGMKEDRLCLKRIRSLGYKEKPGELMEHTGKWYRKLFAANMIQLREEAELKEAALLSQAAFAYVLSWFQPFLKDLSEFFEAFRVQTAFYLGCVQLWERAAAFGAGFCFPEVMEGKREVTPAAGGKEEVISEGTEEKGFDFTGLYELSMAILTRRVPVSNFLMQPDCRLVVVTGANQGGKSTYLRSLGIAQIMMQCGMFVPAASYRAGLYRNIYTHFTRREDVTMSSGRLDEELKRMDGILRTITRDSLLLLNESFATTTEKEGSVIAMELVRALYESGITVAMVTHLLQFAGELYAKKPEHAVFLSAERLEDGTRTYRIVSKAPENTSFGLDLYDEIIKDSF